MGDGLARLVLLLRGGCWPGLRSPRRSWMGRLRRSNPSYQLIQTGGLVDKGRFTPSIRRSSAAGNVRCAKIINSGKCSYLQNVGLTCLVLVFALRVARFALLDCGWHLPCGHRP